MDIPPGTDKVLSAGTSTRHWQSPQQRSAYPNVELLGDLARFGRNKSTLGNGARAFLQARIQPTSAASFPTTSRTFATTSASSAGALPSNVWNDTESLIASIT